MSVTKDLSKSNKTIAIDDSDEDKPVSALIAKKIASTSTHPSTNGTSKSSSDGASSGHKAASHQSSRNDGKTDSKTSGTKHGTTSSSSNGVNKDAEKKKPDSAAKDDSDSEDDMPFVEIIKKREREAKDNGDENSKKKKKTSEDAKNRLPAAPKSQPKNGAGGVSTQFYEECSKGTLVQTFIVRWWYAIEWPIKANIPEPPKGFESLDGYPGVFVSTQTDSLGQILDLRDKETCPSLANLIKKPSRELKQLCITAIENQMKALIEAEGEEVKLLGTLKSTLAEIKAINAEKADREAEKYEKALMKQADSLIT